MQANFVVFYSPGTFFAEVITKPIDTWNVDKAVKMAGKIYERYNARPHSFRFITRRRSDRELDSKEVARSPLHWLGGRIETLAEIEARNDPKEEILRANMRSNGYDRVIVNDNSWRFTGPLGKDDVVLDVVLPPARKE